MHRLYRFGWICFYFIFSLSFSDLFSSNHFSVALKNTCGTGELSNEIDIDDDHHLSAEIHIPNATIFEVDVELRGMLGMGYMTSSPYFKFRIFRSRSSALICAFEKTPSKSLYQELNFGERMDGDFILFTRIHSCSWTNDQLPRYNIEFQDESATFSSAMIRLNVSN